MVHLTEADLRFLAETVAARDQDWREVVERIRGNADAQAPMLADPRLVDRLLREQETLVRISPAMLFAVLLRAVHRELEKTLYVYEIEGRGGRIPVFEAPQVVEFLAQPAVSDYLVDMLCSFTRIQSGVVYWQEGTRWQRRRFCDMDMDDMILLCRLVGAEYWPVLHKRIADIALFLSGIYPDQSSLFIARPRTAFTGERTLRDYEADGKKFYGLAARHLAHSWLGTPCGIMAEKFVLARRALNTLSDRYLKAIQVSHLMLPNG